MIQLPLQKLQENWYSGKTYIYEGHKWIASQIYCFEPSIQCHNELPLDAVPVTVFETKTGWQVTTRQESIYQPPQHRPYYNFTTYLQTQPEHIS